jgi:arylsulfatase A-like enzyme/Tfp pilus assembly protein PilF
MHGFRWSILAAVFVGVLTPACSREDAIATQANVVLITLDTTRADHLGCYGDTEAMTPALDALAAAGVVFEQAYAPSPMTLPSHTTMLTGLNPNEHGLLLNNKAGLSANIPTLATILAERGYRTAAFIAAPVLDARYGLNRGFDVYDDDMTGASTKSSMAHYRPANIVVDAAIDWLEKKPAPANPSEAPGRQPFFMWVHLFDPHQPLHTHPELDGTKFAGEQSYAGEIAFMDRHVGRLTAALAAKSSPQKTMILAVADHGEGLKDHADPTHGMELYVEALRVPLIVSMPGLARAGHRVTAIVSLRDLLPTVLDVLNVPIPQTNGRTLKAALAGDPIDAQPSYAEVETPYDLYRWSPQRSFTTTAWKYIRSAQPELYDRSRDPTEMYNLATVYPDRVAALERDLSTYESNSHEPAETASVQLTQTDRQRLRDLGYLTTEDESEDQAKGARDLLDLRDVKDALQLRIYDKTLRSGIDQASIDPATVAAVAREILHASPESLGFREMLESALADMGQVSNENPPEPNRAAIRARNEEPPKIVERFRSDFADPTKRAKAHIDAAAALTQRGFATAALGHLFEAATWQPDDPAVHLYMAQLFRSLKRTPPTLAHLERAIAIDPRNAGAHYNLGLMLTEEGIYENAAEHYRKALEVQPDNADALNNLGYVLSRQGKPQQAEEQLRAALRAKPSLAAAHSNLAELLADQHRHAEAIAAYEQAIRFSPTDTQAASKLAVLLASCDDDTLRNPERALQLATSAVDTTQHKSPGALLALAKVHAAAGRYGAARETANEAMPRAVFAAREDLIEEIEKELKRYELAGRG